MRGELRRAATLEKTTQVAPSSGLIMLGDGSSRRAARQAASTRWQRQGLIPGQKRLGPFRGAPNRYELKRLNRPVLSTHFALKRGAFGQINCNSI